MLSDRPDDPIAARPDAADPADGRAPGRRRGVSPARSAGDAVDGQPDPWRTLAHRREVRAPGTYLLLIRLDEPARLDVGRLGRVSFLAGWYVYIGSALGGLGARLRRHLRLTKRYHWHVDAIRAAGVLTAVAMHPGSDRLECSTAATVAGLPGGTQPVPRFGSSDCRCRSHLVHFAVEPNLHLGPGWLVVPLPEQRAEGGAG